MCPSQPHLKIAAIRVEILESKVVSLTRVAFSSGQVLLSDLTGRHFIAVFQMQISLAFKLSPAEGSGNSSLQEQAYERSPEEASRNRYRVLYPCTARLECR